MSDVATSQPEQQAGADVAQIIMGASEQVWQQIAKALGVKTREEAVQLAQANPDAQAAVMQIIRGSSALTEEAPPAGDTALTQAPTPPMAPADRLYGGGGKAKPQF